jgi:hypothetical protein
MSRDKSIIVEKLSADIALKIAEEGYDQVFYLETETSSDFSDSIEQIDVNNFRVPGSVRAYKAAKSFAMSMPRFKFKNFDLRLAIAKQIYWKVFRRGYFQEALEQKGVQLKYPIIELNGHFKRTAKNLKQYFLIKNSSLKLDRSLNDFHGKAMLYIQSDFQCLYWKELISGLDPAKYFVYLPFGIELDDNSHNILRDFEICREIEPTRVSKFWLSSIFSRRKSYALECWNLFNEKLLTLLDLRIAMEKEGVIGVVFNAFENKGGAAFFNQESGLKSVNIMNGIKAATGNNFDVDFSKWIVWDVEMRNLLINGCGLNKDQFEVIGHIKQDAYSDHQYSGKLGSVENEIKGYRVLSILSARDKRIDKVTGIEAIYHYAIDNPDVFIIYRPHPKEADKNYVLPPDELKERFYLVGKEEAFDKEHLKDQIIKSDVVITFASTVAIESNG